MPNRILFIDYEPGMRDLVKEALAARDFDLTVCGAAAEAFERVKDSRPDVIVTDVNLEGTSSGLDFCRRLTASRPDIPVIVVTAFGSMEMAIGAIRAVAYDFITKPIDMDQLALALGRAIQLRALRNEVMRLK